jgi:hypothetical protein
VNFYTLTFKKKILMSFTLILVSLIILDVGLYFAANMKSTKTTFINDKFSKISHFKLNNPEHKDIIFIGSSRTFYHISTNTFKKNNLDIYNFGISGAQFEDYPTLIPHLKTVNPKEIVISLSVNRLYKKLNISKLPTLEEIKYYYDIDKIKFLESLKQWVINRHLFLQYSEPVSYKIKSVYEKFEVKKESSQLDKNKNKNKNSNELLIDKSIDYSELAGCKVFDTKQISNTQITLKCTNGDGVLIGGNIKDKNIEEKELKELKEFNLQSIKYLQKLISKVDTNKVKVSIILEPMLHNNYSYNLKEIQRQFTNIKIIDLTNYNIKDSFFSDNSHLNYEGREQYSQYLSEILK